MNHGILKLDIIIIIIILMHLHLKNSIFGIENTLDFKSKKYMTYNIVKNIEKVYIQIC